MINREDLTGNNLTATLKVVGAGEIRCRMRPGLALNTNTKAVHLTKADATVWQGQMHCHHEQAEIYTVLHGAIGVVWWYGDSSPRYRILGEGESVTIMPGVWHDVFTNAGSEFMTAQLAPSGVNIDADRELSAGAPPTAVRDLMREVEDRVTSIVPE